MVAEADIKCPKSLPLMKINYHLRVADDRDLQTDLPHPSSSPVFSQAVNCSDIVEDVHIKSASIDFVPNIRSGSYADIGARDSMDDEHVCIDDLSAHLRSMFKCSMPKGFYAVFDGHGGPHAAAFVKRNVLRLFFEDADWLKMQDIDSISLKDLENSHRRAFQQADLALADEQSVSSSCGTTALTALVLGRHLLVANAGDCRAVLCRKGIAVPMSEDHRPSNLLELKRVEGMGGFVDDGYVNGYISVTRTLGDWDLKLPNVSSSPLIAEPQVEHVILTNDDEFLILGCDGIWDVMSSQYAVSLVRRGLRKHNDPHQSSQELVQEALRLNTSDNLTAIVICFSSSSCASQPRICKSCNLTEDATNRLRSLLEGALALSEIPKKLVVIGAGYIGLEMGSVWGRLGSEITVVEFASDIVPTMDGEVRKQFQRSLEKQGMKFMLRTKVVGVDTSRDGVKLTLEPAAGGEQTTLEADVVLVSAGRTPFTAGLGLDKLGIETDKAGRILVNERFATNVDGVYAIGDVIPGPMLAHKAEEDGVACVEFIAGKTGHVDYDKVPGVVYTHPEVASVGKTEEQVKESGVDYCVGKFPFLANSRAKAIDDAEGVVKILAEKETDKILGVHIMAPNAGELIHEAVLALQYDAASEDIARVCHAHPTMSEALKEAAMATYDKPIHI